MKLAWVLPYIKSAFSDGGSPSSSRLLTAIHSTVACGAIVYIITHSPTHTIDGGVAAGLGGFATVHYGVNRVTSAFGKPNVPKPDLPPGV